MGEIHCGGRRGRQETFGENRMEEISGEELTGFVNVYI